MDVISHVLLNMDLSTCNHMLDIRIEGLGFSVTLTSTITCASTITVVSVLLRKEDILPSCTTF